MDRRIESVGLCLNMECPNCNGPVHVPGLVRNIVCPHCAHKVRPSWKGIDRDLQLASAGRKVSYAFHSKQGEGRFTARRAKAACPECDGVLDLGALDVEAASIPCPGGHAVSVRRAEKMAHSLFPGACWIVGEGIVVEAGTQHGRDLLLINCKACGGEVEIEPSKRDITCGYCSSLNVVPDELWVRLHPELQPREFFLVGGWTDAEYDAQVGALKVWHEASAKKRQPLYKGETELCSGWPEVHRSGLDWLVAAMTTGEREALALEKGLPESVVLRLAEDVKVPVRERLATGPSLTATGQEVLAGDQHPNVLRLLAERKDLEPSVARKLLASGDSRIVDNIERYATLTVEMRLALAGAGRTKHLETLRVDGIEADELPLLAGHRTTRARVLAARHPSASEDLLTKLAGDSEVEVRAAVAAHEKLPREALDALFHDTNGDVVRAVNARPDLPDDLRIELASQDPEALQDLLKREDCPADAFELAVSSDSVPVRRLLAAHPGAPEIVLVGLAEVATDGQVLRALIDRERTPLLRSAMVASPATALREAVCGDPLEVAQLEQLAKDPESSVRRRIAKRSDLQPALAVMLADDPVPEVAELVYGHPAVAARRLQRRLMIGGAVVLVLSVLGCVGLLVAASAGLIGGLSVLAG